MPELIVTGDGSNTLYVPELNETYHSRHGSINESKHVFILNGVHHSKVNPVHILEVGFGTGLNAFLSCIEAEQLSKKIFYTSLETKPLAASITDQLNYHQFLKNDEYWKKINEYQWDISALIHDYFSIIKKETSIQKFETETYFDIVFYDAFAPEKQPEMWTQDCFEKIFRILVPGGFLVTYCAKGVVKRTLKSCGFVIETLPGPPMKREMIRAVKPQ
jgi:tRNA U34 5-methylaminomethyl-2-thiouridine-forming methyltransferase MnmC